METFESKVTALLRKECSHANQLSTFMGQPVITMDLNAAGELETLKEEIIKLIESHFPDRDEDIMITLRRDGLEDTGIKIPKAQ